MAASNLELFEKMKALRNELNSISPTMCMAKWLQSTVTLYNGYTHSCHHPRPHKIDISRLSKNHKELHNTPIKIQARKDMLGGVQTPECDYCWNIENLGQDFLSDRTYKSSSTWAWDFKDEVLKSKLGEDINPTYMEVAFDSTCNFKCMYCTPDVSSKIMGEINQHGPYQLSTHKMHDLEWLATQGKIPINHKEENPYIDAFWEWWPELYPTLRTFRITGGEPLLSKHTWRIFEYIAEHPRKDFCLAINTNMGVPREQITKLVEYVNRITPNIKEFQIFTSAEAFGEQCEYIRHGMVWNEFVDNCEYFLKEVNADVRLCFTATANILGASTFKNFMEFIVGLRKKYNVHNGYNRVPMMIAYLRWPSFQCLTNLPTELKHKYAKEWQDYVTSECFENKGHEIGGTYVEEVDQVNRLVEFMFSVESLKRDTADFYLFYKQYDERRKGNLLQLFPDMESHYKEGQTIIGA